MDDQMIKIEQHQKNSVKDLEKKIKEMITLDLDKLNYVKCSAFESMGNAIEIKITELDEQIDKIEQTQKNFTKDFDKKIKDINIPDLDKLNFVKYPIFEAMGNAIEGKITEMDSQIEKIENQLKTKLKNEVKNFGDIMKETDKLIKQAKATDKSDFATISMIDVMATALDKKIEEIEGKFNISFKGITKYEESQNKSIKELEQKIKDVKTPDFSKFNLVTKPMIDSLEALFEKRIDETEALIKKSDQNQVKSIKDLDKRLKDINTLDVDKSKIVTIQMMDTMTSTIYKKIDEVRDENKKSEQSQTKSIKDLDKKVKDIKVPELDKLNFASASMFEAFVHEVEKKITEIDDQMEKTNQTHNKSIKDLDKRVKDIKVPDLEKLNYVNRPLIDQIVEALEHKITEMDEQIDKLEKNQSKSSKEIENKLKQIKTPEADNLLSGKQGVASMPGIDLKITALDRKIDEVEDYCKQSEQTQSKSIKDLDKKIKDIKIPDLEKTNFVTKPMMDSLAGQIDKKIEVNDESQKKLIKDLDNKIKQIKVPELDKQSIDTKPIIDNLTTIINKKTIEIEQSQDKSTKEIDKKIKDIQDNLLKLKESKDNENILKEINDLKKSISKLETTSDSKATKVDAKLSDKKSDLDEIQTLKTRVDLLEKQLKDVIKIQDNSADTNIKEEAKVKPSQQNNIILDAKSVKTNKPEIKQKDDVKPVSNAVQKTQANASNNKEKPVSASISSGDNVVKVKVEEPKGQGVGKPTSYNQSEIYPNSPQKTGQEGKINAGDPFKGHSFLTDFESVGEIAADLRKYKKRGLKQLAEIELQTIQTMGMLQFNSGEKSPFDDDVVSEEKFKDWANRVQDCRTTEELKKIGKEVEKETNEEFNNIVFSKGAVQDEDSDIGNEYKGFEISDEEVEEDDLNSYADDFDF